MNAPEYIMSAVAHELLKRQDGHCHDCNEKEAHCITYVPKDLQWPVLDDLILQCDACVQKLSEKVEKIRAKELAELQKRSDIEVED